MSSFSCLCLSFTCSWVGVVWSQVCGPTCSSCVLGSSGVSVAPFCRLSLWPHPLLLFSRLGFLPWAFVRTWVGRLRSCLGSYLLFGVLSFPCPLAVEVVTLVLCQVLVGWPSWGFSASGFLGPVVFLVFTLGHLSQALLGSRLRRSVALASGRTLSFCFLAWVFFLGRLLGLGLVGCDPA